MPARTLSKFSTLSRLSSSPALQPSYLASNLESRTNLCHKTLERLPTDHISWTSISQPRAHCVLHSCDANLLIRNTCGCSLAQSGPAVLAELQMLGVVSQACLEVSHTTEVTAGTSYRLLRIGNFNG